RGHRMNHLDRELVAAVSHLRDQLGEIPEAGLAGERQQAAFHQILLIAGEREARALFEQSAQEIVIVRAHVRSPAKIRNSLGAISSSGSTVEHAPAWAADPGMPQTTLVASS